MYSQEFAPLGTTYSETSGVPHFKPKDENIVVRDPDVPEIVEIRQSNIVSSKWKPILIVFIVVAIVVGVSVYLLLRPSEDPSKPNAPIIPIQDLDYYSNGLTLDEKFELLLPPNTYNPIVIGSNDRMGIHLFTIFSSVTTATQQYLYLVKQKFETYSDPIPILTLNTILSKDRLRQTCKTNINNAFVDPDNTYVGVTNDFKSIQIYKYSNKTAFQKYEEIKDDILDFDFFEVDKSDGINKGKEQCLAYTTNNNINVYILFTKVSFKIEIDFITTGQPGFSITGLKCKNNYLGVILTDSLDPYRVPTDFNKCGWNIYKADADNKTITFIQTFNTTLDNNRLPFVFYDLDFGNDILVNYIRDVNINISSLPFDKTQNKFAEKYNITDSQSGKYSLGQVYISQDSRVLFFRNNFYPQSDTLNLQAINATTGFFEKEDGKLTLDIAMSYEAQTNSIIDYIGGTSYILVTSVNSIEKPRIIFQKFHGMV